MYGKEKLKTPSHLRTQHYYFAMVQHGRERLGIVVQAQMQGDAWFAAKSRIGPGMFVSSVTRLWKKDPRTQRWVEKYATLSPYDEPVNA